MGSSGIGSMDESTTGRLSGIGLKERSTTGRLRLDYGLQCPELDG